MMKKQMRKKEVKEFLDKIVVYGLGYSKKDKFEEYDKYILINNEAAFLLFEGQFVPNLKILLKNNFLKKITVDMGAIPYAVKGADMMRPGVTDVDTNIEKGEIICIIDETHHKPVAVGVALYSGDEIKGMSTGKVVKNIHYVGDDFWKGV